MVKSFKDHKSGLGKEIEKEEVVQGQQTKKFGQRVINIPKKPEKEIKK